MGQAETTFDDGSGSSGGVPVAGTYRVMPDGTLEATPLPEIRMEDLEQDGLDLDAFVERLRALGPEDPMVTMVVAITDPLWALKERTLGAANVWVEDCIGQLEMGMEKGYRWIDAWFSR